MKRILAALTAALTLPHPAQADCGCNRVIPYAGDYTLYFNEKRTNAAVDQVTVVNQDGPANAPTPNEPGRTFGFSGAGFTAQLECRPTQYVGSVNHGRQPLTMSPSHSTGDGIRMGEEFFGFITRPKLATTDPNEEPVAIVRIEANAGSRKATPAMCNTMRFNRAFAELARDVHADPAILLLAQAQNLGGHDNKQNKIVDVGDTPQPVNKSATDTYQSLVAAELSRRHKLLRAKWRKKTNMAFEGAVASRVGLVTLPGTYVASSTHPLSCIIRPIVPRTPKGRCHLGIEIDAIQIHEDRHKSTCDGMKSKISPTQSNYFLWTNHPPNLSQDEINAYTDQLKLIDDWLGKHC